MLFYDFSPPHYDITTVMKVMELLKKMGLDKKVLIVTVDNAF